MKDMSGLTRQLRMREPSRCLVLASLWEGSLSFGMVEGRVRDGSQGKCQRWGTRAEHLLEVSGLQSPYLSHTDIWTFTSRQWRTAKQRRNITNLLCIFREDHSEA